MISHLMEIANKKACSVKEDTGQTEQMLGLITLAPVYLKFFQGVGRTKCKQNK